MRPLARPVPQARSCAQKDPNSASDSSSSWFELNARSTWCSYLPGPSPILTVREIYREIFRLFAADFFMCIDVSHLFAGEPCMLRISYYWNRDFDEQRNEIIALKKSRDLAICSLRNHLQKQNLWASHLPQVCSDFLILYGSGMENTYPLETAEVTSISAVAFSLSADQSGRFFTITAAPGESMVTPSQHHRFQDKQIFQLEPSQLHVRPAPEPSAGVPGIPGVPGVPLAEIGATANARL